MGNDLQNIDKSSSGQRRWTRMVLQLLSMSHQHGPKINYQRDMNLFIEKFCNTEYILLTAPMLYGPIVMIPSRLRLRHATTSQISEETSDALIENMLSYRFRHTQKQFRHRWEFILSMCHPLCTTSAVTYYVISLCFFPLLRQSKKVAVQRIKERYRMPNRISILPFFLSHSTLLNEPLFGRSVVQMVVLSVCRFFRHKVLLWRDSHGVIDMAFYSHNGYDYFRGDFRSAPAHRHSKEGVVPPALFFSANSVDARVPFSAKAVSYASSQF